MRKILIAVLIGLAVNIFAAFYGTEEWTLDLQSDRKEDAADIDETLDGN